MPASLFSQELDVLTRPVREVSGGDNRDSQSGSQSGQGSGGSEGQRPSAKKPVPQAAPIATDGELDVLDVLLEELNTSGGSHATKIQITRSHADTTLVQNQVSETLAHIRLTEADVVVADEFVQDDPQPAPVVCDTPPPRQKAAPPVVAAQKIVIAAAPEPALPQPVEQAPVVIDDAGLKTVPADLSEKKEQTPIAKQPVTETVAPARPVEIVQPVEKPVVKTAPQKTMQRDTTAPVADTILQENSVAAGLKPAAVLPLLPPQKPAPVAETILQTTFVAPVKRSEAAPQIIAAPKASLPVFDLPVAPAPQQEKAGPVMIAITTDETVQIAEPPAQSVVASAARQLFPVFADNENFLIAPEPVIEPPQDSIVLPDENLLMEYGIPVAPVLVSVMVPAPVVLPVVETARQHLEDFQDEALDVTIPPAQDVLPVAAPAADDFIGWVPAPFAYNALELSTPPHLPLPVPSAPPEIDWYAQVAACYYEQQFGDYLAEAPSAPHLPVTEAFAASQPDIPVFIRKTGMDIL